MKHKSGLLFAAFLVMVCSLFGFRGASAQTTDEAMHNYVKMVGSLIARNVGKIRENEEQIDIKRIGHPVNLPTGRCRADLYIEANGNITHANIVECTSKDLGEIELRAIRKVSLVPPPPIGRPVKIQIGTTAPYPTPGVH